MDCLIEQETHFAIFLIFPPVAASTAAAKCNKPYVGMLKGLASCNIASGWFWHLLVMIVTSETRLSVGQDFKMVCWGDTMYAYCWGNMCVTYVFD